MVDLFGTKKAAVPPGKEVPLGPPNLSEPDTYPGESNIKEEVGYLPEAYGEPLPEETAEQPSGADPGEYAYTKAEEPYEESPPEGGEYPPFLPAPEGMPEEIPAGETFTREDVEKIAREVADEVRKEFEEKIKNLNDDLEELKKLDAQVEKMADTFEKLGDKYSELEDKISALPTQTQEDLKEIKATVNNINQVMSSALPALIKEVRDLKK